MMTQQLQSGMIAAPLAAIDRRALSQAWYSALGYAQRTKSHPTIAVKPAMHSIARAAGETLRRGRPPAPASGSPRRLGVVADPVRRRGWNGVERRSPRSLLAAKITARFGTERAPQPTSATFRLEGAGGRVQVFLHARGGDVRLIALCAQAGRPEVERALAQAAFSLHARGIALRAQARARCS